MFPVSVIDTNSPAEAVRRLRSILSASPLSDEDARELYGAVSAWREAMEWRFRERGDRLGLPAGQQVTVRMTGWRCRNCGDARCALSPQLSQPAGEHPPACRALRPAALTLLEQPHMRQHLVDVPERRLAPSCYLYAAV